MNLEDYLTLEQARLLVPNIKTGQLGVSRARLQEIITSGALPAVKFGGRWVIRRADLDEFIGLDRREGRPRNE